MKGYWREAIIAAVALLTTLGSSSVQAEKGWFGTLIGGQYLTPGPYPSVEAACVQGYYDVAQLYAGLKAYCPVWLSGPSGSECNFGKATSGCVGIGEFSSGPWEQDCGPGSAMNLEQRANGEGSWSCSPTARDTGTNLGGCRADGRLMIGDNPCDPVTGNKFHTQVD